ncbi:ATP-binding cassette domain-containing protein [Psychrobacter sp. JCM 18900]|uniref:ATP-binding cassette domain-containing protein n=1 Tax=Psychrobacter sp. JCM 18900 TaxID=1298608 RepID=UPI0004B39EE3|nr:ATP-binding cassette domain-containing protein [Psychrobacter sp. JCM 18900]
MPSSLQIKDLQLFRQNEQLLSINEHIAGGDILTVMGPSGSGKSSLLNWLTGTLANDFTATGTVWLNDENVTHLPAFAPYWCSVSRRTAVFAPISGGQYCFCHAKRKQKTAS